MSTFTGAEIIELRIYDDPSNPENSAYKVVLPITVLEAVVDQNTGETLLQLLAQHSGTINGHIANIDVHTTAEWKNNIQQAIGELVAHSQRTDIYVTPEEKQAWTEGAQTAAAAMTLAQNTEGGLSEINGRVAQIEDSIFNGITANPFTIVFESLAGLAVTKGIWNSTARRVEC